MCKDPKTQDIEEKHGQLWNVTKTHLKKEDQVVVKKHNRLRWELEILTQQIDKCNST